MSPLSLGRRALLLAAAVAAFAARPTGATNIKAVVVLIGANNYG
jgi:hypothetical protein